MTTVSRSIAGFSLVLAWLCAVFAPACLADTALQARQLVEVHGVRQLKRDQPPTLAGGRIGTLVSLTLNELDPEHTLDAAGLRIVRARMSADFKPIVAHARQNVAKDDILASLADYYARHLTGAEMDALLGYYRSADGQRFLVFSDELAGIVGDGLLQTGAFDLDRAPVPNEQQQSTRSALINMSDTMRQWQANPHTGALRLFNGLVSRSLVDMLVKVCAEPLDRLAAQNDALLINFLAFLSSPAAQAESQAYIKWSQQNKALFEPAYRQSSAEIHAREPEWRALVKKLQAARPR